MINETINILDELELNGIKENLSSELDNISQNKITFLEGLNILLKKEVKHREVSRANNNIKVAHFPYIKEIKDFNFEYQPSINKEEIKDLSTLRFIEENKNILFLGSSGVGKTHLATALGIEAAKKRNSVYFISCHDLINNLSTAFKENRLENKIKFYSSYRLLIIDEIGYLPISKNEANMFFQLIAKRYEKKPTIITTNQPFSKWGEVFGDSTIASAIIDRLVHHSYIINIKGRSYRIKNLIEEKEEKNHE
ncbi:MAG: IS21-like element helper ATPase IstB [Bacilli bacterium]